jgi:hypothetical protein
MAVVSASVILVGIIVGCMNICVDRSVGVGPDGLCKQTGTFTVKSGEEIDVYYPLPYPFPPNVTLNCAFNSADYVLVGQFPDHFRVKNTGHFAGEVSWEAKGSRQPPPVVVHPMVTAPANEPEPAAVPVSGK